MRPAPSAAPSQVDFSIEVGQRFRSKGAQFRIAEERGPLLILEHELTLERKVEERESLVRAYGRGDIVPTVLTDYCAPDRAPMPNDVDLVIDALPLDMCSPAQKLAMRSVLTYVQALRAMGYQCLRPRPLIELDFKRVLKAHPDLISMTVATVYAWSLKLDRQGGDPRAIRPLFNERGGRGKSRCAPKVDEAARKAFVDLRQDRNAQIRAFDFESRVRGVLNEDIGAAKASLVMPSRSTCSRMLRQELTAYEIAVRNLGREVADVKFRHWFPRDRAERALEVVEFDDKDSRVFLVDEETELPYGRGYVTPGVDQCTGVPLGFSISELPRSTWSAVCSLTSVILPKDARAQEFSLVSTGVEFSGKPGIAVFDNAAYNHADDVEWSCRDCNVTAAFALPYTPTEKACVENFNGRMDTGYFSKQPGYGGPKNTRDRLQEGLSTAVMSVEAFRAGLMKWAYDDFCNDPGEDGFTPRQRWHEQMRYVKQRYPLDINRLRIVPTLRHKLKLRPEGLRFCGLMYQNERLIKFQRSFGERVEVEFRYDPRDMSMVYVFDSHQRLLFVVPSCTPEYTLGLSLYQHRLIRKMARLRGHKNPALPILLAVREELRELVRQTRTSTKLVLRRAARRAQQGGKGVAVEKEMAVSDLQAQVEDIDDVEMEENEEDWMVPEPV